MGLTEACYLPCLWFLPSCTIESSHCYGDPSERPIGDPDMALLP